MNTNQIYEDICFFLAQKGIGADRVWSIGHSDRTIISLEIWNAAIDMDKNEEVLKDLLKAYPVLVSGDKNREQITVKLKNNFDTSGCTL